MWLGKMWCSCSWESWICRRAIPRHCLLTCERWPALDLLGMKLIWSCNSLTFWKSWLFSLAWQNFTLSHLSAYWKVPAVWMWAYVWFGDQERLFLVGQWNSCQLVLIERGIGHIKNLYTQSFWTDQTVELDLTCRSNAARRNAQQPPRTVWAEVPRSVAAAVCHRAGDQTAEPLERLLIPGKHVSPWLCLTWELPNYSELLRASTSAQACLHWYPLHHRAMAAKESRQQSLAF